MTEGSHRVPLHYGRRMDLRQWIVTDVAAVRAKLFDSVVGMVPAERWLEPADGGGSTLTHLLLHIARHQDLAVNAAALGRPTRFAHHRAALGLAAAPAGAGLAEREDPAVSAAVEQAALLAFVTDVFDTTQAWVDHLDVDSLDDVPATADGLTGYGGLSHAELPWLYSMWAGKPLGWLVQWPVIGHGNAHVGEGIALRNRMGLSPF